MRGHRGTRAEQALPGPPPPPAAQLRASVRGLEHYSQEAARENAFFDPHD